MPTAIRPVGELAAARSARAKKSCGISRWMPAPSPVLPSASTAPRCQTAFSASIAASTTSRRGWPSIAATKPTPQASCSSAGSYMPCSVRWRGVDRILLDEALAGLGTGRPGLDRHARPDRHGPPSSRRDGEARRARLQVVVDALRRRRGRRGRPRPRARRRARCRRRRTRPPGGVIMVCQSTLTVPQRVTCSSGASNSAGRSSGSKPSALITRSASIAKLELRDRLGRLPAGRVGRAEAHPDRAHAAHPVVAEEGLGRRQPDELDALLLGVLHLALRARHVGAVAPVEARDRGRALADRGAHAVHRGVAAADHHDLLAGGIERAGVEGRHRVAEALAVARRSDSRAPARCPRARRPGMAMSRAL